MRLCRALTLAGYALARVFLFGLGSMLIFPPKISERLSSSTHGRNLSLVVNVAQASVESKWTRSVKRNPKVRCDGLPIPTRDIVSGAVSVLRFRNGKTGSFCRSRENGMIVLMDGSDTNRQGGESTNTFDAWNPGPHHEKTGKSNSERATSEDSQQREGSRSFNTAYVCVQYVEFPSGNILEHLLNPSPNSNSSMLVHNAMSVAHSIPVSRVEHGSSISFSSLSQS